MKARAPYTRLFSSFHEFAPILEQWRKKHESIAFTNGCFDLLHQGHVDYLYRCADLSDRLVIGLNTDQSVRGLKGPDRPIIYEEARGIVVASIGCVDAVVMFNTSTPVSLIEQIQPDVIVKGADYSIDNMDGASFVKSYGGQVITVALTQGFSTTSIIKKILQS